MKTFTFPLLKLVCMLAVTNPAIAQNTADYKEGEIIVHCTSSAIDILNERFGGRTLQTYNNFSNIFVIELPDGMSVPEGIEKYESSAVVLYAEPNYRSRISLPGDPNPLESEPKPAPGSKEGKTKAKAYFLVAVPLIYPDGESYVLPIPMNETNKIAHARALIELGPEEAGEPKVNAKIAKGSRGINRDYLVEGVPFWDWHVVDFQFASGTIEILDGSPSSVNENWIEQLGRIGFWSYTVVKEIDVPLINIEVNENKSGQIEFTWPDLGDNYSYTLESATSLIDPEWNVLSGGSWPSSETNWLLDDLISNMPKYYRLKTRRLTHQ